MRRDKKLLLLPVFVLIVLASVPVVSAIAISATDIGAGQSAALIVDSNGEVFGWGSNGRGQLGNGNTISQGTVVQTLGPGGVGVLDNIVAVDTGQDHSLALKSDGTVFSFGRNSLGQLGDGTNTDRNTPVQVKGPGGAGFLTDVIAISAGTGESEFSLALKSDGTVFGWGRNVFLQLGNPVGGSSNIPVQVKGLGGVGNLEGIVFIAAGGTSAHAIDGSGNVIKWGGGQLPFVINSVTLTGMNALDVTDGHSLSVRASDGAVFGIGFNNLGQLGDGTFTNAGSTPPAQAVGPGGVGFLTGITDVAVGVAHSIALKSDGTVFTFGINGRGQLGDGTFATRNTPFQVPGLTNIVAIAAGSRSSYAVRSDGAVFSWGNNDGGALGDGTSINRNTPVQVPLTDTDDDGTLDPFDNCPTIANPSQDISVCQPVVAINSITQDGGTNLEVDANISDPNGDALSGEVSILGLSSDLIVLDSSISFTDVREPGVTITRFVFDGIATGPLKCNGCEFSCGTCATATFADATMTLGQGFGPLCGSGRPKTIIANDDQICVRATVSGNKFDFNLESWSDKGGTQCTDNDGGVSCAAAGGQASWIILSETVFVSSPYTGSLPGSVPISGAGLTSGETFTLKITATDGTTLFDGSDSQTFLYQGESSLVFPVPGPVCGDGIVEAPEECDDGNVVSGDGCSSLCIDEFQDLFVDGGTLTFEGIETNLPTAFSGLTVSSLNSPSAGGTIIIVDVFAAFNLMVITNAGSGLLEITLDKGASQTTLILLPGSVASLIGPTFGGDLLIVPLTSGVSVTSTSGTEEAFPLTVQKSFVGSGSVDRQLAPPNLLLLDSVGAIALNASGLINTSSFDEIIIDGVDFTKFKSNALIIAPVGRDVVVIDESEGAFTCKTTELKSGKLVSKMLIKNVKKDKLTCSNGRAVGGSLLMLYDPEYIPALDAVVPFIYETDDNYWDVTTSFTPPAGCTVDQTEQSVTVDHSTEVTLFTLTCGSTSATGAAVTGAVSTRASDRAKAIHTARDCTRPGCPPTTVVSSIALSKADKAQGRPFAGLVTAIGSSGGLIIGLIVIIALIALLVARSRKE